MIGTPFFAYVYIGSALYLLASQIIVGVSWVVIDDREHYRVAKQIHTAPISAYAYWLGRGIARFGVSVLSVSLTIPFGIIAFGLPVQWGNIDFILLIVSTLLGLVAMAAFGVIIASYTLQITRQVFSVGDTVSAALYLLSGAAFPIDLIPDVLRPLSYVLPSTYWLELARRALVNEPVAFQSISSMSTTTLLTILAGMSVVFVILSIIVFRYSMRVAKDRGVLDMETNY
jgi:ABC-2 type transport system permease protein